MKQHLWAAFLLAFAVGTAVGQQIVDQTDLEIETDSSRKSQSSSPLNAELLISGGISDCFFLYNKNYESWDGQKFRAGFQFSGLLKYPLNAHLFIETGLNLSRFGNHLDYSYPMKSWDFFDNSIKVESWKGNSEYTGYYISLPLRAQFKIEGPFAFIAGVDPAYIFKFNITNKDTLYSLHTQTYTNYQFDFQQNVNPVNFILNAGIEYSVSRFSLRMQYFLGMFPIPKPELESEEPFRSNEIVLSVNYRFLRL